MKNEGKSRYLALSVLSLSVGIIAWWFFTDFLKTIPAIVMPGPVKVFQTFAKKLFDTTPDGATLLQHLQSSLTVALSGYAIGVLIGIPLGILMAWYNKLDMFIRPLFDLLRPIPGLAWIPVMIVLFGIGIFSKAMVIFLSVFVACVINSYSGIKQTKAVHLWVGQTFGASNFELLWRIAIPTSLPMLLTGLRVALGAAWTTLIAAELLASTRGVGFMIQQSRGLFRPDIIIVGMITIGGVGALLAKLITLLEKILLKGGRW